MKSVNLLCVCLVLGVWTVRAQTAASSTQGAGNKSLLPGTAYAVVERGANKKVWQRTTYETGPNGVSVPKLHKYVELASGVCYQDGTGAWRDSQEQIQPYASGAIANQGQFQVIFGNNLNSEGAIDQQTKDAKRLRSNILGLAYYDRSSGQSVLIAEVQDSQGELISANQVLYPDAFTGVKADVTYVYKKGSFSQDVTLRAQPPTPESLGLNAATTEIEVLTEFLNPPAATISEHHSRNDSLPDEEVSWGAMSLGHGKAFDLGEPANRQSHVKVRRHYETDNGRTILIEAVLLQDIQPKLRKLPLQSSSRNRTPVMIAKTPVLPHTPLAARQAKPMKLAASKPSAKGLVLDYVELNTDQTDFTFQSDTTYFISDGVSLNGVLTFEGGTVIKFSDSIDPDTYNYNGYTGNGDGVLNGDGGNGYSVNCQTASYRPAVLTSMDDDSVGEIIPGSSGSPSTMNITYLELPWCSSDVISNCRFAYAGLAVFGPSWNAPVFTDCQFVNCGFGLSGWGNIVATFNNCLFAGGSGIQDSEYGDCFILNNVTMNSSSYNFDIPEVDSNFGLPVAFAQWGTTQISVTNSLFSGGQTLSSVETAIAGLGGMVNAACSADVSSGDFQSVGAGNYYLANGDSYHNSGTTNIDPALLADLANKTTYPPTVEANATITTATTLSPTVPRDNGSSGELDLGYHYDAIDYLVGGSDLHASLTLTPGTVLAWYMDNGGVNSYGQPYGLSLNDGSSLTVTGTATAPCWVPRYNTVQEGVLGSVGWMSGLMFNGSGNLAALPKISAQFTKFSTSPDQGSFIRDNWAAGVGGFTDCEIYFGFADYTPSYYFTNCLFIRTGLGISPSGTAAGFTFENCTFWQGELDMSRSARQTQSQWTILNTTFDGTVISTSDGLSGNASYTHLDYNAFLNGANRLEKHGQHDVIVNGAYNWQSSWFGNYYLPANSTLIQGGSTTADKLGLYEFTTQTSQVKEEDAQVDIGYHYVAADAGGNPLSTLWYGTPDYLLDTNGDGYEALRVWELQYFGQLGLDPNASWDGQGNTLLYDYQNGIYPNDIAFSLEVTNNYVHLRNAPVQLNIADGIPGILAVSVDDTNYATDATWQAYTGTNISVSLGSVEGWHQIWVGLKGPATGAPVTWQWVRLKLVLTPPQLVITNPVNLTVTTPVIQLQGYSTTALGSLRYDLSNAQGTVINQLVLLTDDFYDTNTAEFTTNYFHAYDVPLTSGVNTLTLHATDLAGNVATLTSSLTCAPVNPPVVNLIWPQDGMQISGTSFTIQGQVDDPSSTVTLSGMDDDGNLIQLNGRTGRDGNFWVENVPLTADLDSLTLTVGNGVGVTTLDFSVAESVVALRVNAVQAGDTTVSGTIGTAGYTIWANGVEATQDGNGNWTAGITPVGIGGGLVTVAAVPNTAGGAGEGHSQAAARAMMADAASAADANAEATVQAPQGRFISKYHLADQTDDWVPFTGWPSLQADNTSLDWEDGKGGKDTANYYEDWLPWVPTLAVTTWPVTTWPESVTNGIEDYTEWFDDWDPSSYSSTNVVPSVTLPEEHCDTNGGSASPSGYPTERRTADTEVKLATGGPLGSTAQNLWVLSASATDTTTGQRIPSSQITIGSYGTPDTNGDLYVMLPDNDPTPITPKVNGNNHYTFGVEASKIETRITANALLLYEDMVVPGADFCVGEGITFRINNMPAYQYAKAVWSLPGTYVNEQPNPLCGAFYDANSALLTRTSWGNGGLSTTPCWYVLAAQEATVSVNVFFSSYAGGHIWNIQIKGQFNVHRPSATFRPYQDPNPWVSIVGNTLALGYYQHHEMTFGHQIVSENFSGTAGYTQLISGSYTQSTTGNWVDIASNGKKDTELDNQEFPRGTGAIPWTSQGGYVFFWDAPGDGLHQGNASENVQFFTYLRFEPDAGPGPNIFVTLSLVTWNLNDEAANGVCISGNPVTASNADCSTFPDWTTPFNNLGF